MRWRMPPPPRSGGPPVTNIRNTTSPHWRGWLKLENRCSPTSLLGALGCLANAMQSFPQTGDHGDRSNQSGYQHPILNVDAQDAETFNKCMQGPSSDRTAIVDPKEGPNRRKGCSEDRKRHYARGFISTKNRQARQRLARGNPVGDYDTRPTCVWHGADVGSQAAEPIKFCLESPPQFRPTE